METSDRWHCARNAARPFVAFDQRRPVNLNTLLLRILCATNRARPSWHGSGQFLGRAPVLSSFGTRETTTAAPTNQKHAGVAAAYQPGPVAGPCSRAAPSPARSS